MTDTVASDLRAGAAVERLAGERATGALRGPGGAVYLVDGLVSHAESDRAPDLATLLTASGRLSRAAWLKAIHRFGADARVGEALVEQGRLTRGELELCHLGALYDAACFLLDSPAPPASWTFTPGVRHWLGPVAAVGAHRLRREAERRRHLLDRILPSALFDTAPLCRAPANAGAAGAVQAAPAAALGRHARRVRPPTRRQCELLDHADGRTTPAELARLLGRSGFATTADVRRLAAAGLLTGAAPVPVPVPAGTVPAGTGSAGTGSAGEPPDGAADGVSTPRTPGGLLRRRPGAALSALGGAATGPAPVPLPSTLPDITLLIRVRTLLEARL
ncbi:hypothetical protein ACFVVU_00095 [Kitasatospora sp. NPDC057965]|uniref:hypothetical protein n=1 Tax=Kitasatospora sp. NPDC057965 TaxID=3346291 RepID=UPI0036D86259